MAGRVLDSGFWGAGRGARCAPLVTARGLGLGGEGRGGFSRNGIDAVAVSGFDEGFDGVEEAEAVETKASDDFDGRAAFVAGGMTENVAVKETSIEAKGLSGSEVFETHQEMVVIEGDLVGERSRADVVTAACLFAQVNQASLGGIPDDVSRFAKLQTEVGFFAHGIAAKPLVESQAMLFKHLAPKGHIAAASGEHLLWLGRVNQVDVIPSNAGIHRFGWQVVNR